MYRLIWLLVPAAAFCQPLRYARLGELDGKPEVQVHAADAWLMLREDTTTPLASARPSYGRSQAGAVLRYRLAPASAHSPQAYIRASSALAGPLDKDLAAGLSGRPVPRVPLRVWVPGPPSSRIGSRPSGPCPATPPLAVSARVIWSVKSMRWMV